MSNTLYDRLLIDNFTHAAMAAGSDPEPVEEPVATGDVKSHSMQSAHTTSSHYKGLPYQDHNYGAPPPPTPPESPSPIPVMSPVLRTKVNGMFDAEPYNPLEVKVQVAQTPPEVVESKDEGVTRCICNFDHDDGYMICCDGCYVWQHVDCMGLKRNSIPETFFCERCQPREVDRQRAVDLQSQKRAAMSDDSSSDSGDDSMSVAAVGSAATYMAISNSPTRLTLTTHNKHKKMKKKKKKHGKEKEDDKHHKKKKQKRHGKKCPNSAEVTAPMELNIMDEEAMPAWNDSRDLHDRYEEAICNQYSADIQHLISSQSKGHKPGVSPPFAAVQHRPDYPRVNLCRVGKNGSGAVSLVASEMLRSKDFIVEYWGKVMLKEQVDAEKPFFKRHYPYILFYSNFNNVDICVDARNYGNVARFVRRSCSPNAKVQHYVENNVLHFCLFALLNIAEKTEVTIGYDFNPLDCPYPVHCACGKRNCIMKRHYRKQNHQAKDKILMDSSPSPSVTSSLSNSRRTVSPLRVSLAAHNAQNQAQPTPNDDDSDSAHRAASPDDPEPPHPDTTVTQDGSSGKVTSTTLEPEGSEEENHHGDKKDSSTAAAPSSAAKKLTREERKMEAILQAFARLERTEKRRKEAQGKTTTTAGARTTGETAVIGRTSARYPEDGAEVDHRDGGATVPAEDESVKEETVKEEITASSAATSEDAGSVEVMALDVTAAPTTLTNALTMRMAPSPTTPPSTTPTASRPRTLKGRKRKGCRRRSRFNSGASSTSVDILSSLDDDGSNSSPCVVSSSNLPAPPVVTATVVTMTTTAATSSSVTAPSSSSFNHQAPLLMQLASSPNQGLPEQQGMASPVPANSKHFKFPKTKKFFMNEWLNEKAQEASANRPLTIKTEPADILLSSISTAPTPASSSSSSSSPSLQFAKSGPLLALNAAIGKETRGYLEASFGSAKKRWLRQAMIESSGPVPKVPGGSTVTSYNSGSDSPVCNGTLSPNPASYPVSPALSPNTSGINDMMTPLKKRMLRHSIAEDRLTTTPPPAHASHPDFKARSQSTPSTPVVPSGEAHLTPSNDISIVASATVSPLKSESCSGAVVLAPTEETEEFRKSSSIDSGLSVSTPADLDHCTPMLPTCAELQTPPSMDPLVQDEGTPVKDELFMTELEASRRISEERTSETGDFDLLKIARTSEDSWSGVTDATAEPIAELSASGEVETTPPKSAVSPPAPSPRLQQSGPGSMSYVVGQPEPECHSQMPAASSVELQLSSVARRLEMKSDSYSTERTGEPSLDGLPQAVGEASVGHRVRNPSGCSNTSGSLVDHQTDSPLHPRQNFADDHLLHGNLYTSFTSPVKQPVRSLPSEEDATPAQQGYATPNRCGPEPSGDELSERTNLLPTTYPQPLDGPNAADSESPAWDERLSAPPSWSHKPFGSTGRPPLQENTEQVAGFRTVGLVLAPAELVGVAGDLGQVGPGRPFPGLPLSPSTVPFGPGLVRPGNSPIGTPPASVSPIPGTPPVAKKRVSLLEYRKRKGSDLSSSKSARICTGSPSGSSSSPPTPVAAKAPLPALKPPLPSPASNPSTPTRPASATPLESPLKAGSSSPSDPVPQLPNLPLFSTEKENGIGERLSLSTEAQQVISSLTSLLKKHKTPEEEAKEDPKWSSSHADVPDEDPLQKMRKELKEKNRERERKEAAAAAAATAAANKRPHSPDPPPPPPSKKHNPGLRLQIPPPPPPKTKADTRLVDSSGETTPGKMTNSGGNSTPVRTPGSGGIYPQQIGKPQFKTQAAPATYLPGLVKTPFQPAYKAQQYPSQQQQQQQQQAQPQQAQQQQAQQLQTGYNASYPMYNPQNPHPTPTQQFAPQQYHQGQQQQQQQQPGQYKQGYPNPYQAAPPPQKQQPQQQQPPQGYKLTAAPQQQQQQQQQPYPTVGSSSSFASTNPTGKAVYGVSPEGRTAKPPFAANANSYSQRRGTYYQK